MNIPTVPCKTCGEATTFTGTKLCNACWEVERSLGQYLQRGGPHAYAFVARALDAVRLAGPPSSGESESKR